MTNDLEQAEKFLDGFIDKYVTCKTCVFFKAFGWFCDHPEMQLGFLDSADSCCEGHEFRNKRLEETCKKLQDKFVSIFLFQFEKENREDNNNEKTGH
jgi:hypothetical protein